VSARFLLSSHGWRLPRFPDGPFTLNRDSPQARGLVAWWPTLGSRGANVLRDWAGYNNGTLSTPSWVTDGQRGAALSFNGTSDVVTLATEDEFSASSKISLFAWVYPTSVATFHTIIAKRNSGTVTLSFRIGQVSGDGKLSWTWTAGGTFQTYVAGPTVSVDVWSHVGVVFDFAAPANATFYLNGVATSAARSVGTGTSPDDANVPLTMGRRYDNLHHFAGRIGDVRRHDAPVTAGVAAQMYNNPWDLYAVPRLYFVFAVAGVTTQTLTHVTDAILVKTQTATYITDADLKKTQTASHATDTILVKTQTATHLVDAILVKTQTATHVIDANLLKTQSASHVADANLLKTQTASHVTDAVLQVAQTAAHVADAIISKTQSATHLADAILQKTQTTTHVTDADLLKTRTLTHIADAYLTSGATQTLTHVADAILLATRTATYVVDAIIRVSIVEARIRHAMPRDANRLAMPRSKTRSVQSR